MKSTLLKSIGFAIVAAFAVSSCNTDPCKDVVCGDAGTCNDGTCLCGPNAEVGTDGACACSAGYEAADGGLCVLPREKFIGLYDVTEDCSVSAAFIYPVTVSANSDDTKINLVGFWGLFTDTANPVVASINADGLSFDIPTQNFPSSFAGVSFTVVGSGTIDLTSGDITVSYSVTGPDDTGAIVTDVCTNTVYEK
jgi:hypothetical protein